MVRAVLFTAGLELIRALVTCRNDSSASELYPEGGGRKVLGSINANKTQPLTFL